MIYLLLFAFVCFLFWVKIHNRIKLQTVTFFSGGLGSGKTFTITKIAIQLYKRSCLLNKLSFGLIKKREIYSNYPILLKNKVYSKVLTIEHILGLKRLPERVIVVLDECSSMFPNQAKKSDVLLSYNIRWFRHFTGGTLLMADQSIGSIDIEVRRRVNVVYNLHTFRKIFFFYSVAVEQISYMEDVTSFVNVKDVDSPTKRHFGFFPIKKHYQSRYMKKRYNSQFKETNTFDDLYM